MGITVVMGLLGGLALFLYGMQMMSDGLEAAAGDRMKDILEKLTSNRFLGVLVGAVITAVIQSSSATTVMTVGFVNARMMTLKQAVWIIMGANIGTTITGQLIALDIGALAPVIAFIGVAMIVFIDNAKVGHWGKILAGLGVLFIGMDMMSEAMIPLRDSQAFVDIITNFSNPVIGILAGALFTALIQSSSASVGILQALAMSGLIGLDGAVFVLFGQNIGTCITAILASIGTSREAKQTTIIHLSFNLIGTFVFTLLVLLVPPIIPFVESLSPNNPAAQIANMHTIFNVCTTILLLPFGTYLAAFAQKVLPAGPMEKDSEGLMYLQPLPKFNKPVGFGAINVQQVNDEVIRMKDVAYANVRDSFDQLLNYDEKLDEKISKRERLVNFLNDQIAEYISQALMSSTANGNVAQVLSAYYLMLVDLERISDYAINVEKQARLKLQSKLTEEEKELIGKMKNSCLEFQDMIYDLEKITWENRQIDKKTQEWRDKQIKALKEKKMSSEVSVMFSRIFTDFDRINDHAVNVAEKVSRIDSYMEDFALEVE